MVVRPERVFLYVREVPPLALLGVLDLHNKIRAYAALENVTMDPGP